MDDYELEIIEPPLDPKFIPAPYEGDIAKHLSGQHDQSTHGSWASGADIENWNPHSPIPDSPRNAGGMTRRMWDAWEHGADGQPFIELFRKYACQELGLEVPKTPYDRGGYLDYMLQRGWGAPNRNEAKAMLNAIANGKPQPELYRGMVNMNDPESKAQFEKFLAMKPGDQFDMPLVSTTRSLGVATWYAADRVKSGDTSVLIKIQAGAKGVSLGKDNSYYPQDYEVVTSGKFEVVSINKVTTPYWNRTIFEPRKTEYTDGTPPHYSVATYTDRTYSPKESKTIYDALSRGDASSLETSTFKLTNDRNGDGWSAWERQNPKEFTVVEIKMVEPHTVQKSEDFSNQFFFLFNNVPFIRDEEEVLKHGTHDQKTHGSWATGGTVYTSIIDRLSQKDVTGFSLDISSRNEPTSGYMCSNAGAEETVTYDDFFSSRDNSRKILLDYIEKNADALSERGAYFGIWVVKDQGTVYLDVSRRYDSRGEAVRAGFSNDQQSVYDIENDEYIYMKDEVDDRTTKAVDGGSSNPRQSNDSRGEESLRGGDSQRNREESPHVCLGRYQGVTKHLEGQHDQATHGSWASGRFGPDSVKAARDGAKEYAFKAGIKQDDSIDYQKTVANRARAARIADAYDELPTVQEEAFPAYEALATEVDAQFEYMTKTLGIKVEFVDVDPYKTSREMFADASKGVLKVLKTASTGSHPFFTDEQNDKFRAVHDFFGHAATGRGFGQDGEESAWVHHSQMFSETARGALTTETRGQNSWYNTRGQGFAEQKVALLPKEFWEVPETFEKRYRVIKFEAGLIPTLKHLEGQHDQQTHGRWATAGYTDDQQRRLAEFADVGPSLEDIRTVIAGPEQPGIDDLIQYVENDAGLYQMATEDIDARVEERLAALQAEFPLHEYTEQEKATIYEDVQRDMIDRFVQEDDGTIAQAWQSDNGGTGTTPDDLVPFFEEVYNFEHTGTNPDGVEHTIRTEVSEVGYGEDGGSVDVKGYIYGDNNETIGQFHRQFYIDNEGNVAVEHKLLAFYDDGSREEYAGTGFGKEYILNQEAWATQAGIDNITVFTGWDGARHWARAGYDWDENEVGTSIDTLIERADYFFQPDSPERAKFDSIIDRAVVGYIPASLTENMAGRSSYEEVRLLSEDNFPIPAEIANIGYTPGATEWAGKTLLQNANLYYKKRLQSAEAQSITEGPVDRDGDGLVYDGTPREKPAPSK